MGLLHRGFVLAVLISSSASWAEKPRVVVLDFTSSSDDLKRAASSVAEQVLTELARTKTVEVLGTSDVLALLGMERQRQLLGCEDDSSSCLAEITAGLGAPWLVMGNLAQLGKVTRLDIKLIRARDGKAVLREGKNLADDSEIFDLVNAIVPRMLEAMELKPEPNPAGVTPPAATVSAAGPAVPVAPWIVLGTGAAAVLAGGAVLIGGLAQRDATLQQLNSLELEGVPTYSEARGKLEAANTMMVTGSVVAGVGVAALVGGLVWKLKTQKDGPAIAIIPGPASVLVRGEF